jgi:hypothetical protein
MVREGRFGKAETADPGEVRDALRPSHRTESEPKDMGSLSHALRSRTLNP